MEIGWALAHCGCRSASLSYEALRALGAKRTGGDGNGVEQKQQSEEKVLFWPLLSHRGACSNSVGKLKSLVKLPVGFHGSKTSSRADEFCSLPTVHCSHGLVWIFFTARQVVGVGEGNAIVLMLLKTSYVSKAFKKLGMNLKICIHSGCNRYNALE